MKQSIKNLFLAVAGAGSYGVFSDGTKGGQRQGRKG
jgi:hypothetical protein